MKKDLLRMVLWHAASYALVAGFVVARTPIANAQAQLTCSEAAHAYACCEISKVSALELLKSCVHDRRQALGPSATTPESKPPSSVNPLTCHDYAGRFSIKPESRSANELVYLEACADADIAYRRKGL